MIYTSPPLSTTTLIANLKTDGLSVNDENFAEDFLNNVSYFRFNAYLRPFEDVNGSIRFKPNTTFDKAVALYRFDAELRNLLFSKILRTFAVTVPTTLPIEQRTKVGLLLFIRIRFSKQPLDYLEILKLLKSRGLIIRDESMAIELLESGKLFSLRQLLSPYGE